MAVTETTTQTTQATVAQPGANGAPKPMTSTQKAIPKQKAPKSPKAANKAQATKKAAPKEAKPKKAPCKPASKEGRAGTKSAKVLDLIRRPNGPTLKEIMKATDWQAHSVRGFISGALVRKMGLKVESAKREDGERTYRIAK